MYTDYKVGDKAWIHGINTRSGENPLTEGTIIMELDVPGYIGMKHYLIEIPTSIDPLLEVREPWTMSPAKDKPIGLWYGLRKNGE